MNATLEPMNAALLLKYIQSFWLIYRHPPTIRTLTFMCRFKSTSAVIPYLKQLEADGKILPRKRYGRHIIPSNIRITFE